jgi:site-specific DNA-methyltransferase (adenine-specific)
MGRFQFFPDLTADEFAALKASIAVRGVDVPIIVDQTGEIIDGFHRQRVCDELGVFCPREIREFMSDADKFELALALNCRRRQLNREQKRDLIEAYLRRDPQINDNHLAETIGGISKNTVADVRADLEATCQIDKFERHRGRDGKVRPTKYKRIIATSPKSAERALAVIGDLPDSCFGTTLDITTAKRRASHNRNRRAREERHVEPFDHEAIKLHHCRFQDLAEVAGIEQGTADLWFTDIPYDRAFAEGEAEELGTVAASLLRPGGVFITYSGQYCLPQVINGLSRSLNYRWTGASLWRGQANRCHAVQARSKWKPLVIFSNGNWKPPKPWVDVHESEGAEKQWHPWQQPLRQTEYWIERFSHPGNLVIDGCGGGFTTAVACYRLGRRCVSCDCDESCLNNGHARLAEAISGGPEGNCGSEDNPGSQYKICTEQLCGR